MTDFLQSHKDAVYTIRCWRFACHALRVVIFYDGERVIFKVVIKVVIWDFRWIGKAGTEFFTGSQDGYMKWWDIR